MVHAWVCMIIDVKVCMMKDDARSSREILMTFFDTKGGAVNIVSLMVRFRIGYICLIYSIRRGAR